MKFIKRIFYLCICLVFFTGCGKENGSDVLKGLSKKIDGLNSYHLSGVLEIINNEKKKYILIEEDTLKATTINSGYVWDGSTFTTTTQG
jgi:outer membrane lipoprotein-sorting protein